MRNIYIIIIFAIASLNTKAQLPGTDSAWVLQTSLSDEFNAAYIDSTTKWYNHYGNIIQSSPYLISLANGAELNYGRNLISTGTTLKIKADTLSPNYTVTDTSKLNYGYSTNGQGVTQPLTFAYQGGVIFSQSSSYKFGYLEVSAKYPSHYFSLWPAFWIQNGSCGTPRYINEVDIAESSAPDSYQGNWMGNNYWITDSRCSYDPDSIEYRSTDSMSKLIFPVDSFSGAFHKFALKWDPDNFTYFFNDSPTTSVTDTSGQAIPQNGLHVFLNFCVEPWHAKLNSSWIGVTPWPNNPPSSPSQVPTKWPQYFEIDYMRYYKLGVECNSTQSICVPTNYNRKVKKSITVGGGSCTPTFNQSTSNPTVSNSSYTLRATDYVLLDASTTINPSGTGYFAIEILPCPQ